MKTGRKFKRKTMRQWAAFARKGARKRTYESDHFMHDFEDEVILRKWHATGRTSISPKELGGLHPDLFHPRYLKRAMGRMAKEGTIERGGFNRFTGGTFKLKEHGAHRAARAA